MPAASQNFEAFEFTLDPAAFAEDAPALDFNDPVVAEQVRAKLLETAARCAAHYSEIRHRSWELGRQIFIG